MVSFVTTTLTTHPRRYVRGAPSMILIEPPPNPGALCLKHCLPVFCTGRGERGGALHPNDSEGNKTQNQTGCNKRKKLNRQNRYLRRARCGRRPGQLGALPSCPANSGTTEWDSGSRRFPAVEAPHQKRTERVGHGDGKTEDRGRVQSVRAHNQNWEQWWLRTCRIMRLAN